MQNTCYENVYKGERKRIKYEAYSDSEYRFAVKIIRVKFRIKFYCYQILHSSNYISTYSPPLLRHLSLWGTSFVHPAHRLRPLAMLATNALHLTGHRVGSLKSEESAGTDQ